MPTSPDEITRKLKRKCELEHAAKYQTEWREPDPEGHDGFSNWHPTSRRTAQAPRPNRFSIVRFKLIKTMESAYGLKTDSNS
jgi:hypothetical protein